MINLPSITAVAGIRTPVSIVVAPGGTIRRNHELRQRAGRSAEPGAFAGHRDVHERLRRHGPGPRTGRGQRLRRGAGQRRGHRQWLRSRAGRRLLRQRLHGPGRPRSRGHRGAPRPCPPGGVQGRDAVPERAPDLRPRNRALRPDRTGGGPARRGAAGALHAAPDGAPASVWAPGSFAPFASVPLACAAGVVAEREDAAFYTPYLSRTDLPQDVRNVFTNLQRASLENHLPAFERCQ